MWTSQKFNCTTIILLYLSTFAVAWPVWPRWLPELDSLVVRADSSASSAQPTATADSSTAKETAKETAAASTTDDNTASKTGSSSATGKTTGSKSGSTSTGTGKTSGKTSGTTTQKSSSTSYDARIPAGGISMITPAVASGSQYFKIGDYVTFAWNYTSLSVTPTALNIVASCSANSQVYTIASNQTISNATGAATWDTGSYQATAVQNPLLTETYTLVIYDAAAGISATAAAGSLAVFSAYSFGMYVPQAYTPLSDFQCATCSISAGLSDMERRALGMVLGMGALTVLSFTWFVGGLGVIW